ncbi:helix-turn-helix domain-containing protein [Nonomuraea sp. NPDC049141]|uniref:helix-turn-helix domain-containing protein n=1 Tax=Nonomuraea sp. NPDC049141 TaxID=3155500 RepID=UPI0033CAC016
MDRHSGMGLTSCGVAIASAIDGAVASSATAPDRLLEACDDLGAHIAAFLRRLIDEGAVTAEDAVRISTTLQDAVADHLASELGKGATPATDDPQMVPLLRIQRFIEQRLGDRDLSPATIASAHHVSLRYLQRLFQQNGLSVATWIRERRLERCRRDLADPKKANVPVRSIGAWWGFLSDAHFNRAFRAAYGVPPATYRQVRRGRQRAQDGDYADSC